MKPCIDYRPPPDTGLDILYRDDALLVVEKPSGLLSVPGRGVDKQDSLALRVQAEYPDALNVHRLDMETSGLMVMARGASAHRRLSRLFQDREVSKHYVAIVNGNLEENRGEIDLPLITDWPNRPRQKVDHENGKPAKTCFNVVQRNRTENTTRLELRPETGRTHQLRVHTLCIGHAILGDRLYAIEEAGTKADRLMLHASYLAFRHPLTMKPMHFASKVPF